MTIPNQILCWKMHHLTDTYIQCDNILDAKPISSRRLKRPRFKWLDAVLQNLEQILQIK